MFTETEEKQIKRIVRFIAIGIPLILIVLSVSDFAYHRLFYTKTDARVVYVESEIVGTTTTQFGMFGRESTTIEVEYNDLEGCTYTATLPASNRGYIGEGDIVSVIYRNSNHGKCKLQ